MSKAPSSPAARSPRACRSQRSSRLPPRRWQAALAAEIAHGETYSSDMSQEASHEHDAVGDELHGQATALLKEIARTPAETIHGLAVKGRLLAYEHDVGLDEASIAEALDKAHYLEDRVALSIALDAVRLTWRVAT